MPLTPDKVEVLNGVTVKTYLLTQHNPNKISLPKNAMPSPIGVTIHNTGAMNVASNTTMAEQYTRATINGNMNTVRVHFYVDDVCAWQNLPINIDSWHAADGNGNGNRKTISFEVIGNSAKAEANAAKLAAYFLNKIGKTPDEGLFTHTHWLNVRDGKKGTIDYLNTLKHPYKTCPIYIIPHWGAFKATVKEEYNKLGGKVTEEVKENKPVTQTTLYRVRKTWEDTKTQVGAYSQLENAKKACKEGYSVFDSNGKKVYPVEEAKQTEIKPVETKPVEIKPTEKVKVTFQIYTAKKWQAENFTGIEGCALTGIAVKSNIGTIKYRVHQKGSRWMGWITNYKITDLVKGMAGIPGIAIDGIQMELTGAPEYQVKYRVSTIGGKWLPWVNGLEDYAGLFGKTIDRVEIEIVKK